MDLLDKLVLPISGHNLNFLNYLLTLATIIFLTYAGILFGSTLLSFIYNRKAEKDKEIKYSRMSRDYIDIITSNAAFPFGLGIFPFLAIIFMYQQLLYKTEAPVVGYLLVSFLLFLLSLWLIQLYKFSLHMKSIFGFSLKSKNLDDKDFNYYDMVDFRESSERINSSTAVWGVLLLFLSMLLFIGATALAVDNARWASVTNIVILIFNEITIIKFLHFITAAFALTGVAFITKVFYWDKERIYEDEEYNNYAKKINAGLALTFILLQPIFFAINLISTPDFAISTFMFGFTLLAFFMVFLVSHMLYKMIRDNVFNKINIAFFVTIILFAFIFIKEQDAFAISNKNHVEELTLNYKDELQNELAKSGRNVEVKVNGEEIYKTICSSCHAFDKKLVGPPHRDVLPKYIGKKAALVKFILNPVKVNPDYPAMPKQNLTPREAEAVADYMLKELAKKLKK